jgi:hypothetical protein
MGDDQADLYPAAMKVLGLIEGPPFKFSLSFTSSGCKLESATITVSEYTSLWNPLLSWGLTATRAAWTKLDSG